MQPPPGETDSRDAPVSNNVRRKFARKDAFKSTDLDMGPMATFGLLKMEADNIQRLGYAHVLEDTAKNLKPLLHPYLNGSAARSYDDTTGEGYIEENQTVYAAMPEWQAASAQLTGTQPFAIEKEMSLEVYCRLITQYKTGSPDTDKMPMFYLDTAGGKADPKKSGGFVNLYERINVPVAEQSKQEQNRCLFAMKSGAFQTLLKGVGKRFLEQVTAKVQDFYKCNVTVKQIHVLFHWNAHSFFTYHKDDGDISAIVNLSDTVSEMHVAGFGVAKYDGIGSGHLFPAKVNHRSCGAPRRCIKVAVFFDRGPTIDVSQEDGDEDGGGPSGVVKGEVVKDEPSDKLDE